MRKYKLQKMNTFYLKFTMLSLFLISSNTKENLEFYLVTAVLSFFPILWKGSVCQSIYVSIQKRKHKTLGTCGNAKLKLYMNWLSSEWEKGWSPRRLLFEKRSKWLVKNRVMDGCFCIAYGALFCLSNECLGISNYLFVFFFFQP